WSHVPSWAGPLFQAPAAEVGGRRDTGLLDVAVKLADHLDDIFGPTKRQDVDGHPVVEMGLVELYRVTGETRYLQLARHFVDARGQGFVKGLGKEPTYFSDRVRVREATTVEGHAVRAVYLGAGGVDVATETGDAGLLLALETQFASMMSSKAFITGGLGARWDWEAFGDPYELPTDRGYAESCAAIGGVQWAWRLLLATGKQEYADAIERFLFNAFLPGVSLSGTEYFYVNPLQLRDRALADENRSPAHGRRGWFDCACCPPNVMRTFSSLDAYIATSSERGLQIHQFASGDFGFGGGAVTVRTDYPWSGDVEIEIVRSTGSWHLDIRVPDWSDDTTLTVNGEPVAAVAGTYASITREFVAGDVILLQLDLTTRLYAADTRIDAVRGAVAIERGPLVYALEHCDVPGVAVDDVVLNVTAAIRETRRAELLDGIVTLQLEGTVSDHSESPWPYRRLRDSALSDKAPVALVAIPYYAWANREVGPMRVWFPTA
ncbi:MAG: glycoside hydrolase family 127 protein, partial [Burkholderiaceae bacterium]|nr:glycoside hydrolase family 127 protein [Microbacteriaceae bacterium]